MRAKKVGQSCFLQQRPSELVFGGRRNTKGRNLLEKKSRKGLKVVKFVLSLATFTKKNKNVGKGNVEGVFFPSSVKGENHASRG